MRLKLAAAFLLVIAATGPTKAAIIPFSFQSKLLTGPLAGTAFPGTGSFDNSAETGVGTEYFLLASLNFTLLGHSFTAADIDEGGQAILQNGALQSFTAAYFVGPLPVQDIAFGFGGPGIIGYIQSGQYGDGVYTLSTAAVPEPGSALLVLTGAAALAARVRLANRR